MSSETFITELECLKSSKLTNPNLSFKEKEYIMKKRKERYIKLLLDNLNFINDSDILNLKICLESELISFQDILDELNLSSEIVVPTSYDSLVIERNENYQMTNLDLKPGENKEKRVMDYISKLIPSNTNWRVDKSIYNSKKKKFEILVSNPCQNVYFTTSF